MLSHPKRKFMFKDLNQNFGCRTPDHSSDKQIFLMKIPKREVFWGVNRHHHHSKHSPIKLNKDRNTRWSEHCLNEPRSNIEWKTESNFQNTFGTTTSSLMELAYNILNISFHLRPKLIFIQIMSSFKSCAVPGVNFHPNLKSKCWSDWINVPSLPQTLNWNGNGISKVLGKISI